VILMRVAALMRKYQVRRDFALQFLKDGFHFGAYERHKAVGKLLENDLFQMLRAREEFGGPLRLIPAHPNCAKDNPVELYAGIIFNQTEDCSAAADFDVIGVASQTQYR
jgi:hypothetical protein